MQSYRSVEQLEALSRKFEFRILINDFSYPTRLKE